MLRKPAKSRRMPPITQKLYTPEPVRGRVIALHVSGQSNRRIASTEGIDRETVSRILSQQEAVDLIGRYRSQLLGMMPKALQAVEDALSCDDPRVKAAIAMMLVDKLGGFEQVIGLANAASPESEHEDRRLQFLGSVTDMALKKARRFDISLPPELEAVEQELRQ